MSFRFCQVGLVLSLHDGTLDGPWPGNRGEGLVGEDVEGFYPGNLEVQIESIPVY